jgi:hypothetical protein
MAKQSDFDPSVPLPLGLEIAAIRRAIDYMQKELAQLVEIYLEQANVFSAIVGIFGCQGAGRGQQLREAPSRGHGAAALPRPAPPWDGRQAQPE